MIYQVFAESSQDRVLMHIAICVHAATWSDAPSRHGQSSHLVPRSESIFTRASSLVTAGQRPAMQRHG